jgi:hypothetical protein
VLNLERDRRRVQRLSRRTDPENCHPVDKAVGTFLESETDGFALVLTAIASYEERNNVIVGVCI